MIEFLRGVFDAIALGFVKLYKSGVFWWDHICKEFNNTENNSLIWLVYIILFTGFFIILINYIIKTIKFRKLVNWISKNIFLTATVIWIFGVAIYIVGFCENWLNGLAVVPRAIISSFKMFVVSNDLARVCDNLRADAIYMTIFTLVHFLAAFVSSMFVFKLVGYRFNAWNKIRRYKKIHDKSNKVHIFWGINEPSLLLAENIRKNYVNETIIFIDIDEEDNNCSSKKMSFNMVLNNITVSDHEMARIESIKGALIDHCYNGPASIETPKGNDMFAILHLKDIGEIVENSKTVNHYFLSSDEKKNFQGALNLQNDYRVKKTEFVMHIHARKNANNEIFDHYSLYEEEKNRINIKIIDSAYLSIQSLKKNDNHLPVKYIKFDKKTGLVSSPFTSLIVGFGGTGQEAFKFLYEFSAFVDKDMKKSKFKCYAVDKNMKEIAGLIRAKMPAIGDDELSLINTSVDSEEFWNQIKSIIDDLNYVVITMNNDVSGMSFAVNLFKYALRYRSQERPKLKIMIRCYDHSIEQRMSEVRDCLNKSTKNINVKLDIFGTMKDLYNCDNIISDTTLEEAMEFHRVYENSKLEAKEQWEKDFVKDDNTSAIEKTINEVKINKGIEMSRFHAIYDINRRISQNISNSLHCSTKMILMGLDSDEERLKLFYYYANSRKEKSIKYNCCKENAQLLQNMAMVEHERWIASHKLMGYIDNPQSDFVKKYHCCICPWEYLNEETQSYDCNVVDTTIKLAYNNITKKNN